MKKLIMTISVVVATSLTINSCHKENLTEKTNQSQKLKINENSIIDDEKYIGIDVEGGVLTFKSIDYYESIVSDESEAFGVDELTNYLNSTTFKSYGKKFAETSTFDEPFMDAIMNEDQVVKIGEWFIYIDIPSEKVLAISDMEVNAYNTLITKTGRNLKEFNIGDDVLDHLENNTSPQERSCGGIGGGTYVSNTLVIGSWFTEAYVDFFRAGIYFNLKAGAAPSSPGVATMTIEVQGPEAWCERRPCGDDKISTSPAGAKNSGSGMFVWPFYTNVRNLNGYYLFARLKVNLGGTIYYTNYAGRNINSPY